VAKRLIDIKRQIEANEVIFKDHLKRSLDDSVFHFLDLLSDHVQVYIFSGIIRDFFLKAQGYRDVDLFIEGNINIEKELRNFEFRKNSFGGYKININGTNIDLWFIQDTWALKNHQSMLEFDMAKYIPQTAFFNFSSIIFSFNENKFYSTKYFNRFLRDRKVDLVYKPNANYALCVVNSFYYSDKLNLKMGEALKKYVLKLHKTYSKNYEEIQKKHFGKILYSEEEINNRVKMLED
jgi:hypothetical protein